MAMLMPLFPTLPLHGVDDRESPVRGFYCQAQRLANVFTEYLRADIS